MDGGKPARERQALFEGNASQSAAYAKHRPSPPQALFDAIATYAGPGAPTEVALDVATGACVLDTSAVCTLLSNIFFKIDQLSL